MSGSPLRTANASSQRSLYGSGAKPRPPSPEWSSISDIQDLLGFERMLSALSTTLAAVPVREVDHTIVESLAHIVKALAIDRSALTRVFALAGDARVMHSYVGEGIAPVQLCIAARELYPWALSMAIENRPVTFSRLDDLPPEASIDKESWRKLGLRSHVMFPIMVTGHLYGALSFSSIRAEREWPDELLGRMRLLAEIFGSALARKRAQEELDFEIGFGRVASRILASLVMSRPNEQTEALSRGLREIGEYVGADRVALWHWIGHRREL